jgi:hypothetical protein
MKERPVTIYLLISLWLLLSFVFLVWGVYSVSILLELPNWQSELTIGVVAWLHFGYTISTIVWFVFAALFVIFAYKTLKKDYWVWATGIIISTIFLAIFSLMLASFMINAALFGTIFSINGLITVVLSFIIDLGIIFYLTRPITKMYFDVKK